MSIYALPFPRGSTFGDMGNKTMTAAIAAATGLAGRVFQCEDSKHGLGELIKLRIVQNETGEAITVARKLCEFRSTTLGDYGTIVDKFGNALSGQGVVAKPLDDVYVVGGSIPEHDLFYMMEEGLCTVLTASVVGTVSLPAGTPLAANAEGTIHGTRAAAGYYVIGSNVEPCYLHNTNIVIRVNAGLVGTES